MAHAIALAERGAGQTSPNPLVGAVICRNGHIVGEGYHERAGSPHAEVNALRSAGDLARGGTLYVNLEPCNHHGRTPPCTEAIIGAGIRRVVVANTDPNPLVNGSGIKRLKESGIEVTAGVLEEEGRLLNEAFFHFITTGRPFVVLKYAMTLDGKIATKTGDSKWISGTQSRELVYTLRSRYDAVMTGIGTILADDPLLTARPQGIPGRDPIRIILDSRLRIPFGARVLNTASQAPTWIVTTGLAPREKADQLGFASGKPGQVEVIEMPLNNGRVDLTALADELGRREITSVLLEGGGTLNAAALEAGIVNKVICFIAPKIIGGLGAPGPILGDGIAEMCQAWEVRGLRTKIIGSDIMVEGYITPPTDQGDGHV